VYNLAEDGKTNHKINVYSGIYAEESKKLLQEFFNQLKNKGKLKFSPPTA